MSEHTERELIRVLRDIETALAVIAKMAVIGAVTNAPRGMPPEYGEMIAAVVGRTEAAGKAVRL